MFFLVFVEYSSSVRGLMIRFFFRDVVFMLSLNDSSIQLLLKLTVSFNGIEDINIGGIVSFGEAIIQSQV